MKKLIVNFLKENDVEFQKFVEKWYHGDYTDLSFKYSYHGNGLKCEFISEWDDDAKFEIIVLLVDLLITLADKIEQSSLDIYK